MSQMVMGIDPTKVQTSTQGGEFKLGTRGAAMNASGTGVKEYVYVQADSGGVTGAGYVCDMTAAFVASMSTTTTTAPGTGQGKLVGVGVTAIAASGYGWLQVYGPCSVRVAANCAAFTNLDSTATAGQIDDDATASSEVIEGLVATAAAGGAAATVAGFASYPRVGRTL